ncbi:hypothetical protein NP493_375g02085 [Ridgeia piscesae]|uniref:RNA helicase n=1 Tax=Ridgeia piscesae TaxID=27915 RepID=A0AAD9NTI0_RIDPI|nr:hypothetical protein NP493_375g02085 [Ridgeia piscesae]
MFGRNLCCCCGIHQTLLRRNAASMGERFRSRITVPQKMVEKLERIRRKDLAKRHQEVRRYKGPVVISCKRQQFNHHKGQTYSNFSPEHLASGGWKDQRSKGDYFTINAVQGNPALQEEGDDVSQFTDFGLHEELLNGLQEMGIKTPTNVQVMTIPHLLDHRNVLCAAETGSGKTLAFLLPIIEKIHRYKQMTEHQAVPNQPYSVIVTPSRELTDQIQAVSLQLSQYTDFTPISVCGGRGTKKLIRSAEAHVSDILISTPGVLSKLLTNRIYNMSRLHHLVLDEADTLLDDSFSDLTMRLIGKMKISSESVAMDDGDLMSIGTQVAMVGATMPSSLKQILGDVVPVDSMVKVMTPHLHRLMPHIPQKFVRIGSDQKPETLLKALKSNSTRRVPTLVFCNRSNTANYVGHFLNDNNIGNVVLHAQMPQKVREGRFDQFQNGETEVLVCTDIMSRGMDTIRAKHVINYDFPHFISDYIHRAGRIGRVGSSGTGFVLSCVSYKWDVDLLWKIEASARRATEFHNVNANIKRKLSGIIQEKYMTESDTMDV